MERYVMFMDLKTHCCSDIISFQIDVQIQCNLTEDIDRHFVETDELILKFIWK